KALALSNKKPPLQCVITRISGGSMSPDENLYRLAGNQVKIVEIKANKKNSKISSQSYKNSVNFSGKTKKTYVVKSK
ncbi:MAG: hypothetical protein RSC93_10515, partial [Erysipelotrichaceae bacterium]